MNRTTITQRIGDDGKFRVRLSKRDLNTNEREAIDLSAAYVYFEVRKDPENPSSKIFSKDNDPAGENTGIEIVQPQSDPDNRGKVDVCTNNGDLSQAVPGSTVSYALLLREDPLNNDDRHTMMAGDYKIEASRVTVPSS